MIPGHVRRRAVVLLVTLSAASSAALAQGQSIAVGAALPQRDLLNTASNGYDIQFQELSPPLIGPLSLRLDIGFDHLGGRGFVSSWAFTEGAVSLYGPLLARHFYWFGGLGLYNLGERETVANHTGTNYQQYLGAQAGVGINISIAGKQGTIEAAGVQMFPWSPSVAFVPIRLSYRI